jgi:hypothetical protein
MNSNSAFERAFPLPGGTSERPALRTPRLSPLAKPSLVPIMGNRAFVRAWAARRAALAGQTAKPFGG